MYQLNPLPYFNILHSLLRPDGLEYDRDATAKAVEWLQQNASTLRKVCFDAEYPVLMAYYGYWDKHKEAPSRPLMHDLIVSQQKPEALLNLMDEYDKHADDLTIIPAPDLHHQLDQRIDDYEKYRLSNVLEMAGYITVGSHVVTDAVRKTKIEYEGPKGALRYLHQCEQDGILLDHAHSQGGALADTADRILARYEKTEAERHNKNLFIPTGIPPIDNMLGGLRRKEVNGLLGFVGQRKTSVVRFAAHTAASLGFRVLYIPLESDYEEEETAQLALHASYCVRGHHGVTKKAIERGELSKEDKALLPIVAKNWKESVAKNLIVRETEASTWAAVRSIIERECDKEMIDLVVIDYLTLLSTPGVRDDIADKIAIIQDAKRLAMTASGGKGLCILTPVQGNRKGLEDAAESDGAWTVQGIAKYSELDKSLDNVFYVYFSDSMSQENRLKIGSCKTRRDGLIPATFVSIDQWSGRIRPVTHDVLPGMNKRSGWLSQALEDQRHLICAESI